jgi:hypothetical protein
MMIHHARRQVLGQPPDAFGVAADEDEAVPAVCELIGSGAPEV